MEYDHKFDNLGVGTPVTGSYTRGVRVYKGVISQVQCEDPHKPPYFVKLYKDYPEKSLWFYPWEIQSIDKPTKEQPHIRPEGVPPGYRINPENGELERIRVPKPNRPPRLAPVEALRNDPLRAALAERPKVDVRKIRVGNNFVNIPVQWLNPEPAPPPEENDEENGYAAALSKGQKAGEDEEREEPEDGDDVHNDDDDDDILWDDDLDDDDNENDDA